MQRVAVLSGVSGSLSKAPGARAGLWVNVWTQLLRDIVADPISQQRTMVDILNEPDSRGLGWRLFWHALPCLMMTVCFCRFPDQKVLPRCSMPVQACSCSCTLLQQVSARSHALQDRGNSV